MILIPKTKTKTNPKNKQQKKRGEREGAFFIDTFRTIVKEAIKCFPFFQDLGFMFWNSGSQNEDSLEVLLFLGIDEVGKYIAT